MKRPPHRLPLLVLSVGSIAALGTGCNSGSTSSAPYSANPPMAQAPAAPYQPPYRPPPTTTSAPYSGPGRVVSTTPVGPVAPGYRDEMGSAGYQAPTASAGPTPPPAFAGPSVATPPPPELALPVNPPPPSPLGSPDATTADGPTPAVPATPTAPSPAPAAPQNPPAATVYGTGFHWAPTLAAAQAEARQTGRLIFLESGRESCGNCQKLRKTIIPDASNALGALAVGYYDDCDVDRGSQAFWILRNNLPNAVTLPLAGFVTADLRWVSGFSGHTEADRFQAELDKARAMK